MIHHENFRTLSTRATKLLIDIAAQYRGSNNGDLCAPFRLMKQRGWRSSDQLYKARDELLDRELIVVSRQGGRNRCTLYALTWLSVDDCDGKLDINASGVPSHNWKSWVDPHDGSN
tara:strand:+ start:523 stop:870 length:348 start_codon:yes stop_codon:yes gene_type:complete